MELFAIIKLIFLALIVIFLIKVFSKKYIQWQVIKRYKTLLSDLGEKKYERIPIEEFTTFLAVNINIYQDAFFKEKLKEFIDSYSSHYKQTGISFSEIFICWLTRIEHDILYTPDDNISVREYQSIYESENEDVFKKIEHQYKLNIKYGEKDELLNVDYFILD
jgi:hypothetical protein